MLLHNVRHTIKNRKLLNNGDKVLVAVSGGPDSIAMLDVLHWLKSEFHIELHVASVDHGLRPEAKTEVEGVGRFAQDLGLAFHPLSVNVELKGSIQEKAREARYAALFSLAKSIGAVRICVGHTLNDQAETVLARLLRGNGVRGLAGIIPHRSDGVIRPLIDSTREEVVEWLKSRNLTYIEDPSNSNPKYQRSRIRHGLLPDLIEENPAIVKVLARLADEVREIDAEEQQRALSVLGQASLYRQLNTTVLKGISSVTRREVIRLWLEKTTQQSVRRVHVEAVEKLMSGVGAVKLPSGWHVTRSGRTLTLNGE